MTRAADEGLLTSPILLVCPPDGTGLETLPGAVLVYHDSQPEHDRFARLTEMRDEIAGPAGCVVVSLPRTRLAARDLVARAAELNVPLLIDGQKTDGIDSMLKAARARGTVGSVISKAHGKLFVVEGGDFADWRAALQENSDGFLTPPGGFSADGIDPGSRLLIDALPPLKGRVADLGAGWGALSVAILGSEAVTACDLVEADRPSLDCARRNVVDSRARFHWADATAWAPEDSVDHVVTNPPFHKGRAGDPGIGRAFLTTAARILAPRGVLWMVANRHLPYESHLETLFGEVAELSGSSAFKLFRAARPRRPR
ncbi:16S rRNA (guanine1207-N2)-methyltransferase [Palleronia marisminoris]|uniref:Ribosomal RNA small subunit methyltransferase C n=1 Tax=Palleronia marisminoris TaxID=315423 RepID=A0A1Y5SHH2_9RHOB|nr:methyltransferase [Palleronia marisminoris]SFG81717.1 16S rRNA (guanine1207-N2)-methyltransferase [Palleronia marisminoris]SLN40236.1 Ribosomal RNA small subunit methyltransferase C [Palleronia marisminoris]